jgi:phosphoserine phosphatase RsbU/P
MEILPDFQYTKFTILIVDDDPNIIYYLQRVVSKKGFVVKTANDITLAKELLKEFKIDVMLLDVNMPGGSGYAFCKDLRREPNYQLLPIIFITAIDRETGLEEAIANGGDDYLNKPINVKELLAKLHAFCRIKALQDIVILQNKRYAIELKMARRVQELLNPQKNFSWNGYSVHTFLKPFIQIGGDYADVWQEGDSLHIIIADSIGHGPAGALLSAMFKMQLSTLPKEYGLKERIELLRTNMIQVIPQNYMITFFYGILHKDSVFEYSNGGNPYPLIYHNGSVSELEGKGPLIMDIDLASKTQVEVRKLERGSILMLYTDGASEATSPDMKMIDSKGLIEIFKKSVEDSVDIIPSMMNKILAFCGENPPQDDIALIIVQVPK